MLEKVRLIDIVLNPVSHDANAIFERMFDIMLFKYNDKTVGLYRHSFHFYDPRDGNLPVSGEWVLELYYHFKDPNVGWGKSVRT